MEAATTRNVDGILRMQFRLEEVPHSEEIVAKEDMCLQSVHHAPRMVAVEVIRDVAQCLFE